MLMSQFFLRRLQEILRLQQSWKIINNAIFLLSILIFMKLMNALI